MSGENSTITLSAGCMRVTGIRELVSHEPVPIHEKLYRGIHDPNRCAYLCADIRPSFPETWESQSDDQLTLEEFYEMMIWLNMHSET